MLSEVDRNWVEICRKSFSFGKLVHRMWELRQGFLMREMEMKEAQYRENWLAQQSHTTQAKAVLDRAEALKRSYLQREGEHTSAVLCLNLSKIGEISGQKGIKNASKTTTPSEDKCQKPMVLKDMNKKEKISESRLVCACVSQTKL